MRDCEVIVAAPGGAPDFEAVMERFMSKKSAHQIVYCFFDVSTKTVGQSPTSRSLWRKTVLNSLELNHPIEGIQGNGLAYFALVKEKISEGIVLKKADSPDEINTRSHYWLKVINYHYTEVVITGTPKRI